MCNFSKLRLGCILLLGYILLDYYRAGRMDPIDLEEEFRFYFGFSLSVWMDGQL